MKVLLIDLDKAKYPNLALMKLSAWHKSRGDEIWFNFGLQNYDRCYCSCVFTWNALKVNAFPYDDIHLGGSGFKMGNTLPYVVEHIMPDYSLYDYPFSLGFTSRGCIKSCPWCIVTWKEGSIKEWAEIDEFLHPNSKGIVLYDNNLLAAPNAFRVLKRLAELGIPVDFNQGLDISLVTDEVAHYLAQLRFIKRLRFAFDVPELEGTFRRGMKLIEDAGITMSRVMVYMLIGFNTTLDEDMERVKIIRSFGADPFVMPFRSQDGKVNLSRETNEFARWVNRYRFRHITWEGWKKARGLK